MKRQFYHNTIVFAIIISIFCVLDFLNIYAVNDALVGDLVWVTVCTSICQTLVIDGCPLLLGDNIAYLKRRKGVKKPLHIVIFTVLITIMAVFFTLSFLQRITSQDVFLSNGSSDLVFSVSTATVSEAAFKPSMSQRITLFIIGLLPLGTSILSFFISFSRTKLLAYEDTIRLRQEVLEKQTEVNTIRAFNDGTIDYQSAIDEGYKNMLSQINIISGELKNTVPDKVRRYLVTKTKTEIKELQKELNECRVKISEYKEIIDRKLVEQDEDARYNAIVNEVNAVEGSLNTLSNLKLVHDADSCSYITNALDSTKEDRIKVSKIS